MSKKRVSKKSTKQIDDTLVENSRLAGALGLPNLSSEKGNQIIQDQTLYKNIRGYLVSNNRNLLAQAYAEIGLVQTIVDVPVEDALRGGIEIISSQVDPEEIEKIEMVMSEKEDLTTIGYAAKWNRLFGGAGVVVVDSSDVEDEFKVKNIKKHEDIEFVDVDMWELFFGQLGDENKLMLTKDRETRCYNYYGMPISGTRVLEMKGIKAPSIIRQQLRGWGLSVVETLIRSINQYLKSTDLVFEVLDEFKIDIYKLKGFASLLSATDGCGMNKAFNRIQAANMQKNYQNAITLDSEDEYAHKQLSFSGLGEVQTGIRMQVASDMRMPLTKIFGISAAGFNSGEDDIEVYNAMVESQIRQKIKKPLLEMVKIRFQQELGFIPDDLKIEFKPLRIMSAEQDENIKTQQFNRVLSAKERGEITRTEFRDACNKNGLLPIQLESIDVVQVELDEENEDGDNEMMDVQKLENPNENLNKNSKEFLRRKYEAAGGDGQYDPRRRYFFENPVGIDKSLWSKAKDDSVRIFGRVKWQFVLWQYRNLGGKENHV